MYPSIEVVDPICLTAKLVEPHECDCQRPEAEFDFANVPESVQKLYDEALVIGGDSKRVYVSLGLFSIIKLTRNTQLLVPSFDFCIPDKECVPVADNPCDLFEKLNFPIDEFFPPLKNNFYDDCIGVIGEGGCGCSSD